MLLLTYSYGNHSEGNAFESSPLDPPTHPYTDIHAQVVEERKRRAKEKASVEGQEDSLDSAEHAGVHVGCVCVCVCVCVVCLSKTQDAQ